MIVFISSIRCFGSVLLNVDKAKDFNVARIRLHLVSDAMLLRLFFFLL